MSEFPSDWKMLSLEKSMAAIIDYRGKTPGKSDSGVPLITAKIVKNGRINFDDKLEFIPCEIYDFWMNRGLPEPGDVVMTMEAPLGEVAQLDARKVALGQRLITLRGKPDLLDNNFLKYLMLSAFVQNQIHARGSGTTVIGIKQSELRKVTLALPPLPTQRRIAQILGRLDDKIELNRRINRTLEAMAQALYRHHFVEFGPYQDGPFIDSELGSIPEGWAVGTVEDIIELAYGKGLPQKTRIPGPYPVFGSSGQVDNHKEFFVKGPGIIVGRKGTIGSLYLTRENFWPIDTTYFVIPKRKVYSLEYIYQLLSGLGLENRRVGPGKAGYGKVTSGLRLSVTRLRLRVSEATPLNGSLTTEFRQPNRTKCFEFVGQLYAGECVAKCAG